MYAAIVFLPLLGSLIAGFGNRAIGDRPAQLVTCAGMFGALELIIAFFDARSEVTRSQSTSSPGFLLVHARVLASKFDTLTAVMLIVVTGVSTMVHVYSIGYMSDDPSKPRFMAYLSLFTFAMLMLVTADNGTDVLWLGRCWSGLLSADWLGSRSRPRTQRQ